MPLPSPSTVKLTLVINDGKLSLFGLFEQVVGLLQRDSFLGRDQVLNRCHDVTEDSFVRVGLALEEVNVSGGDDPGQFS